MSIQPGTSSQNGEIADKPKPIRSEKPLPTPWLRYHASVFSHMSNRIPWQDVVAKKIYASKSEGVDRMTISSVLGMNGNTKFGNRKVSGYIHMFSKGLPKETGFYQKLTGRCRVLNFYHKSFEPQANAGVINEITNLLGRECPFKLGDSIRFPGLKLTNMKITDVALRRLKVIIERMKDYPACALRELMVLVTNSDAKQGLDCQVDRKTITKYAYALQQNDCARVHKCKVAEDDSGLLSELVVLTWPEIEDADNEFILKALEVLKKSYNDQGRSFPHGQLKKFILNHVTIPKKEKPTFQFELQSHAAPTPDMRLKFKDFYQRKMIRAHLLHSLIHRAVYHPDLDTSPSYYELFPDEDLPAARQLDDMYVFDDTKDSFFRYVPPIKPLEGLAKGWFTLRMILRVMPLSMFVLCFNIVVDEDFMMYLKDPTLRHILLSDLPTSLRVRCINKKIWTYADVACTMLCGMGLLNAAPDSKRVTGPIAMFYCKKGWNLYDTSVCKKAYSTITESASELKSYDYVFSSLTEIDQFWYHFRAIALSTPLNSRSERGEVNMRIWDKYGRESYKKEDFSVPSFDDIDWVAPVLPGKGACLTDAPLFAHLKRHWDMNAIDNVFVAWFTSKYIEIGELNRKYCEAHVQHLNHRWLSTMQCMAMPQIADRIFKKNEKRKSVKIEMVPSDGEGATAESDINMDEPEAKKPKTTPSLLYKPAKGKRTLDEEDIESANRLQSLRNRFTNRERDMFVLLRAVSQFLNPVGKMWVDPTVVRRIMKAYFEESNDKTINAMTGASMREFGHRREEIWHLVRGLGSFQKMKEIRDDLAAVLTEDVDTRGEYFCQAFDIAYRSVTRDIPNLPSVLVNDDKFDGVLDASNLTIGVTSAPADNPIVVRLTTAPTDLEQLKDNLYHDWIVNNVLNEWLGNNSVLALSISSYKGSALFHSYIEKLHDDGVLCRSKVENVGFRTRVSPSAAFLGYFSHSIRPDIFSSIVSLPDEFDQSIDDNFGAFLRIANALRDPDSKFHVNIEAEAFTNWKDFEHRRNLRDTENGALRLTQVVTAVESLSLGKVDAPLPDKFSEVQFAPLVENMEVIEGFDNFKSVSAKMDEKNLPLFNWICEQLVKAGVAGVPISIIRNHCAERGLDKQGINELLNCLEENFLIFKCGFDVPRYVSAQQIKEWTLPVGGRLLFVKPWTNPDGSINLTLFRWFSEMVFVTIHESPCIDDEHLKNYFCGAIHGALVEEILEFFVDNRVIDKFTEQIENVEIKGPFKRVSTIESKTFYRSVYRGFERFTLLFADINLPVYNYADVRKPFQV